MNFAQDRTSQRKKLKPEGFQQKGIENRPRNILEKQLFYVLLDVLDIDIKLLNSFQAVIK